jgi:hypothetical protein
MNDDKTKKMLREWGESIRFTEGSECEIREKILNSIKNKKSFAPPDCGQYILIPRRIFYATALAASLLIILLPLGVFMATKNMQTQNGAASAALQISADEIESLKIISSELDKLFSDSLLWASKINNDKLDIVTGNKKSLLNTSGKVVAQYIVMKKTRGSGEWKKIYSQDFILRPGEPVCADNGQNSLWIYPADSEVYAVDSQISLKTAEKTFEINFSGGQLAMTPLKIQTIKEDNSEYAVFQNIIKI